MASRQIEVGMHETQDETQAAAAKDERIKMVQEGRCLGIL